VGKYSANEINLRPNPVFARDVIRKATALKVRQKSADDWLQTLFMKRRRGRRMSSDLLPPYHTDEGLILTDRRSQHDRRRALDQKLPPVPATN
jgi:hypothetical protein